MAQPPSSSPSYDHEPPDAAAGVGFLDGLRPLAAETTAERFHRWRHSPSAGPRALAVVAVALVLAVGAWWLLRPPAPPIESALPLAASATGGGAPGPTPAAPGAPGSASGSGAAITTSTVTADLVVQASGGVVHPGVYRLEPGSRVDDLVQAAGGLGPDADGDRVNLAAPVVDGERIWVPRRGELTPPPLVAGSGPTGGAGPAVGGPAAAGGGSGGAAGSGLAEVVHLNTATAEQLDTLPGVGPATATAILAYRDEHGKFSSVDDLLEVRGIGDAKLEQLRPLVDL